MNDEQSPPTIESADVKSTGLLEGTTAVLIIVNLILAPIWMLKIHGDFSFAMGETVGRAILNPLIVVALFQIGKSFRNRRSRFLVFNWTSVLMAAVSLQKIFIPVQEMNDEMRIADEIRKLNADLPNMIDESQRLETVSSSDSAVRYEITIIDQSIAEIDVPALNFEKKLALAASLCDDADTRTALESGATFMYSFSDSAGEHITDVSTTIHNCPTQISDEYTSFADQVKLMNANLPSMIDESQRLESVSFGDSEIRYEITIIDRTIADINVPALRFETMVIAAETLCNTSDTRTLLESDTTFIYSFSGSDGKPITEVTTVFENCP